MSPHSARKFLRGKVNAITSRARRLAKLTPQAVGFRPEDKPYVPSQAHFDAVNTRLAQIDKDILKRLRFLHQNWRGVVPNKALVYMALVEREIDRARRVFGMFFEVFSQRGTAFGPSLAAHDSIATDCYAAVRASAPHIFKGKLLKPITYMEHGYSPATMRRGISISRLMGEPNPFPLIRIPWDRDQPWQAVFLHEASHNLQADLRLWQENQNAVRRRMLLHSGDLMITSVYSRWHKEIFADLGSVLLGGPASVWGAMDFLAHPGPKTLTFKPQGVHPTGYLRVFIMAELLRRMGFGEEADRISKIWKKLYDPGKGHRMPVQLINTSSKAIPEVVDEVAYQARRNLAQRALADVISFGREDEKRIRKAAATLLRGKVPSDIPPRFFVSASQYALYRGADSASLSRIVINHLSKVAASQSDFARIPGMAVAGGQR